MTSAKASNWIEQTADNSVVRALLISLVLHLGVVLVVEMGIAFGWWTKRVIPVWLSPTTIQALRKEAEEKKREVEMIFVSVDPSQASDEPPPEETRFYSSKNARAANPESRLEWNLPNLDGTQDKVFQAADRALPLQTMLQPAPPPAEIPPPEPAPPAPEPAALVLVDPGDQPAAKKVPDTPVEKVATAEPPPRERPRRLDEVLKDQGLAGKKMKQEGGVPRRSLSASFDVKGTLFGAYDEAIVRAIQARWYQILDEGDYVRGRSGKVVLEFHLNFDGRISQMRTSENTVTELMAIICQRAVEDPSPYARWPGEMRRLVGRDYREVRFTFYYH